MIGQQTTGVNAFLGYAATLFKQCGIENPILFNSIFNSVAWLHHMNSFHIIPYHSMSFHIISYHFISFHIISYHFPYFNSEIMIFGCLAGLLLVDSKYGGRRCQLLVAPRQYAFSTSHTISTSFELGQNARGTMYCAIPLSKVHPSSYFLCQAVLENDRLGFKPTC